MRNVVYGFLLVMTLSCSHGICQNYATYNSYYINPYLYNPAEAASDFAYVFVNHRQQWLTVEGAPVLTTINAHTLLDETRAGIGFKASSFKRGILNTTDVSLTYAYGVPLNQKSTLFFGLSGGAISNSIEVNEQTSADPAVANYLANNIQPAANFGMMLKSPSGIKLGVALPQLFTPKFNSTSSFENTSPSPVDNVIVSFGFQRKVEGKIVSKSKGGVRRKVKTKEANAPLEFYALYKYEKIGTSQFEAMAKLNLSQNFWLGAAYRQSYGFSGSLGFTLNKFLLAYSYEPGNQPQPQFSTGTHEIQLGLKLSDLKKFKRQAPQFRSTLQQGGEQHRARFEHENEDPDKIHETGGSRKKYLVVIRSFNDFTSADEYKKKLIEQKFNANIFYYEKDKKYHVHVFETTKQGDGHQEVRNLKNYSKLKDARLLTVEE